MSERAPKCKHRYINANRKCKDCGDTVDIRAKRNKYGNRRTDGFASAKEARRFMELKARGVENIERQVPFSLIVNGELICYYWADFVWRDGDKRVVEDVKPTGKAFKKTAAYRLFEIKKRLMKACHGVDVVEV